MIKCQKCGGDLVKQGEMYVCQVCGEKYPAEEIKERMIKFQKYHSRNLLLLCILALMLIVFGSVGFIFNL
jgi:DNA-directed RNA polymerase subunit M/transcription elongation factor TFIIS